jgi:hypothetical protein
MIGFAVYLNGKKLTLAGADDLYVLNAIVTAVGALGKVSARNRKRSGVDLHFSVGGLTGIVRTTRPSKHQSARSARGNTQELSEKKLRLAEAKRKRASRPKTDRRRRLVKVSNR